MKRVLKKVPVALIYAVGIWLVLSFIEIISKNGSANPQYCPMNLFEIGMKYIKPIW